LLEAVVSAGAKIWQSSRAAESRANKAKYFCRLIGSSNFGCSNFIAVRKITGDKTMAFMFEKLEVYQKSMDLAEEISNLTDAFGKGYYYLKDQVNRVALSVSANIAEGNGRFHKNDRKQFFYIARGSAHECVPILELCRRKSLITAGQNENLKSTINSIAMMLSKLIRGMDKKD
jgi:four helix bundle protein